MPRTALVLGGGGLTGIGWETGMLKGLQDLGIDLTTADTIVGTSAGSVVGTQLATRSVQHMYDAQLQPPAKELGARVRASTLLRAAPAVLLPGSGRTRLRRLGAAAQAAHPGRGHERVEVIRHRIKVSEWPDRDLRITAINADTGEFVVLTRDSGMDIVHTVAASCAVPLVWPPVALAGTPHMDGGVRSPANIDVASDATEAVVVLAPLTRSLSRQHRMSAQLARLQAAHRVVITPDEAALKAFGRNVLNPAKRADAARAGLRQAADVADQVRAVWT